MKINNIENKINLVQDSKIADIIYLLIDAIRTYPSYDLDDLDTYIEKVKKDINKPDITIRNLKLFVDNKLNIKDDEIWVIDSINSLIEALELMDFYDLNLDQILSKIKSLE